MTIRTLYEECEDRTDEVCAFPRFPDTLGWLGLESTLGG